MAAIPWVAAVPVGELLVNAAVVAVLALLALVPGILALGR